MLVQPPAPSPSSTPPLQMGEGGRHSFGCDHMSSAGHGIWKQGKEKDKVTFSWSFSHFQTWKRRHLESLEQRLGHS